MLISKNGRTSNGRKFLSLTKVVTNVVVIDRSHRNEKNNKLHETR